MNTSFLAQPKILELAGVTLQRGVQGDTELRAGAREESRPKDRPVGARLAKRAALAWTTHLSRGPWSDPMECHFPIVQVLHRPRIALEASPEGENLGQRNGGPALHHVPLDSLAARWCGERAIVGPPRP